MNYHGTQNRQNIVLCLMATLSLVVFAAGPTHAAAEWKVLGKKLEAKESVQVISNTSQLLEVPSIGVVIHCNGFSMDNGVIANTPKAGHGEAIVLFTGCETLLGGTLSEVCRPNEGRISASLLSLTGKSSILFQPLEGPSGTFTTIEFPNASCSLSPSKKVVGTITGECPSCPTEAVSHTFRPTEPNGDTFKFGANAAVYKGEATVELSGADNGKNWSNS